MLRLNRISIGWMLLLFLSFWSFVANAEQPRDQRERQQFQYRYVSFDQFIPTGYNFFDPVAIDNGGRVYGTIYDEANTSYIVVFSKDVLSILQPGNAWRSTAINDRGTVGGFVFDPSNFQMQAALFHGKRLELIPPQPGETSSEVIAVNDRGTALVSSNDDSGSSNYLLYRNGQSLPLYFDPYFSPEYINNQGIIAGTVNEPFKGLRGFRFDSISGEITLLNPLPSDTHSWVQGINNRGDVLGYSFIGGGKESIGVWDRNGTFKTHFTEGIPKYPTISNSLLFNDRNLIVITGVSKPSGETNNSYLVPKPGVRLDLAIQVDNLPLQQHPNFIIDINNHGSMIGYSTQSNNIQDIFLLERTGSDNR